MKYFIFILTFALVSVNPFSAMAEAPASKPTQLTIPCQGDAKRATPPIPNYPTHIRNVVWKNMRAMCVQPTQAQKVPSSTLGKAQVK